MMTQNIEKIKNSLLFKDIKPDELQAMLVCLRGAIKTFEKNETVLEEGKILNRFGLLVRGKLQVIQYDYLGNRAIISNIESGQIFGEAFSYVHKQSPLTVEAVENSEVLFLDSERLSNPCENCCGFHKKLINNLLFIIANKNVNLTQKIECMSKKTTKEKLLTYLSLEAGKNNSKEFSIPFDRQGLADYLGVERSAMSAELGKLKKDKIIDFEKNKFRLS